jgi:hypothetical protein
MVSLGIFLIAVGCGAITLEGAGTAAVCFSLGFVVIRYA